jgi:hypothetical protein
MVGLTSTTQRRTHMAYSGDRRIVRRLDKKLRFAHKMALEELRSADTPEQHLERSLVSTPTCQVTCAGIQRYIQRLFSWRLCSLEASAWWSLSSSTRTLIPFSSLCLSPLNERTARYLHVVNWTSNILF